MMKRGKNENKKVGVILYHKRNMVEYDVIFILYCGITTGIIRHHRLKRYIAQIHKIDDSLAGLVGLITFANQFSH